MNFRDAAQFRMPFGKYAGKTLDDIATTDQGLIYLDWLRGEREKDRVATNSSAVNEALAAYLDDKTIAADVERLAKS